MKGSLQEMPNRFRGKHRNSGISFIERCALFAGLLLALILVPHSFGQGLTGSISGTVTDSSEAPISGATVTVRQVDTNAIRTITTSDVGTYKVTQLVPGVYNVRVEKEGFKVFEQGSITLAIDQVAQIDAKLDIGSETQTVNVTAEGPVLQTENSSVGLVVDSPTFQNTPLNGHLSILGLLNLVPGVQDVAAQDQVPVRGVTLAFGTNQRNSYGDVGFTFDGVSNMEVMLQRGEGEVPPLDTLSQFKVITSGAAAEFNQPNQVIIVSQGGVNQLHGEVLEFNRGKGTSAKQYFGASQPRPPYERNEYGGNLSGPIYIPKLYNGRDRSFFAFGYEGFHLTQSVSLTSQQPTALMRQGNFTEFSAPIINPATGQPFAGNWQDNAQSPARGAYSFNGRYTGNAYADFLLGFPNSTGQATPGDFVTRYLSNQYGMYVQDDFKPTPKLTLNYGIRYDLQWFGDNPYGTASLFVPSVGKVVVFAKSYPAAAIPAFIPDTVLAPQVGLPTHLYDYLGQDKANVAPRFGFAYQAFANTVIRGAVGLFYNLMPSSYIDGAFGNLPFVSSVSYSQPAGSTPQFTMNAPFAGTGAYGANPSVIAQHSTTTPYTEQYNLAIEHQFGKGVDMRIGYVGQRTIHQNNFGSPGNTQPDINLPPPAPGVVQNRRPFQPFSTISENFSPIFHTTGNSLQIGVHKQYSHGFMINAEYQWIRVLGVENFQNPANIGDSYGNISNITPQTLEVSYAYALPFGRGKMLFHDSGTLVDKIISGWQIAGITSFQTGQPFSATYTAPGNPVGLVSGRANRVPGVSLYLQHKTLNEWFNPAAFTAPPNFTYGTSGYNMLWGPHYQNWDMNLMKNIGWKERYNLQLRADAFNVFNHPNFSVPSAAVSNPSSIGKITSQVNENRTMEFAAKFSF